MTPGQCCPEKHVVGAGSTPIPATDKHHDSNTGVQAIACIVMSPLEADTPGACFRIGKERWWRHIRAGVQRRAEATPEARGVVFVAL